MARVWAVAALLGAVGYALNLLAVPLLPGLQLLFGAVPAFLVAIAYGPAPGALAGAIAGARTLFLWGHPYGWILLAVESAVVGLLRSRTRPVFAVALFWFPLGLAFGLVSYGALMGVPWFAATIAILKQVLNGLVNGLLAEALVLATPLRRLLGLRQRPRVRQYLGVLAALSSAVPLLALWIMGTRQQAAAAIGAAEVESRVTTLLFSQALAENLLAGGQPDTAEIAALRVPDVTLRAMRPGGPILRALPDGRLASEPNVEARRAADEAMGLVAHQQSGTGSYSYAGVAVIPFLEIYRQALVVAQRVGSTGWVVWSELPFDRILAPLSARVLAGEVVMILALFVALLLALVVARRLEEPIAALVAATERLGAGELEARVPHEALRAGAAEPILLGQRLNAMAERLRQAEEERAGLLERERNAREEAERRAREEAALREATQAVTQTYTAEEVIRQIAGSALVATAADGAYVERVNGDRGTIRIAAAAGELHPPLGAELPLAGSYAESVLETGAPILIARLADAERPLAGGMADRCPDCAAVVVPLLDSGSAIGALLLVREAGRQFRQDEVRRAATFANLAALAFRKVHLLEESEQRREELERVMESRARLIRGFSHDVKNPLGAADGYLQLLEEQILGELSPKQRESIVRVRRALHAALSLIDDLVELARAEAGQLQVQNHAVDLRDVVKEMAGEYRAQAEAAGLSLTDEFPDRLPLVRTDDRRVRQVLGNLLSNAVKYTPEGGRIGTRLEMSERDGAGRNGPWIAVHVWDTGRGIPEDRRDRIFQEFTRLEPGSTPGAGLGLAIARRVARAIGGDLTFASTPGEGSTFTLWLPCDVAASGA